MGVDVITSARRGEAGASLAAGSASVSSKAALERSVCAAYLAVQTVGGIIQWIAVFALPAFRRGFELVPDRPAITTAFLVPDVLAIGLSGVAAFGVWRRRRWAGAVVSAVAGLVAYPTIYLAFYVPTNGGDGLVALAVMVPTALCSLAAAIGVHRLERGDRVERRPVEPSA